jgi:hypothetical protein
VSLSGVNDAKVRLVGKLHGDGVLLTLGASLPSGTTALEPSALEALSVLSAPALRFRTPTLGSGPSGTAGLVVAGQNGAWSFAAGGAFEKRGTYAPSEALTAGLGRPAIRSGDAVHLSLGADRVLETSRQAISLIADVYTSGELRDPSSAAAPLVNFRLGPTITGTYQVQATINDVESMLYIVERYRGNYAVGGTTIDESWRMESEIGLVNSILLNPQSSLRVALDSRFHTAAFNGAGGQTVGGLCDVGNSRGGCDTRFSVFNERRIVPARAVRSRPDRTARSRRANAPRDGRFGWAHALYEVLIMTPLFQKGWASRGGRVACRVRRVYRSRDGSAFRTLYRRSAPLARDVGWCSRQNASRERHVSPRREQHCFPARSGDRRWCGSSRRASRARHCARVLPTPSAS